MFHAISKILFVFTTPITWIFLCFLLGFLWRKRARGKRMMGLGVVLLYLFTNTFVLDEVNRLWEPAMNTVEPGKKYDVAIVLGGYATDAPGIGQINFFESADRLNNVLPLYFNKQVKKILLCGGAGNLVDFSGHEADFVAEYLYGLKIPKRDIIIENQSRNTRQNAVNAKRVLDSLGISERVLLVTSTTHMPRSSACFDKMNILHDQYRVDGQTGERKFYFDYLFLPNAWVLYRWNVIFHEWIGLVVYKMMGYI